MSVASHHVDENGQPQSIVNATVQDQDHEKPITSFSNPIYDGTVANDCSLGFSIYIDEWDSVVDLANAGPPTADFIVKHVANFAGKVIGGIAEKVISVIDGVGKLSRMVIHREVRFGGHGAPFRTGRYVVFKDSPDPAPGEKYRLDANGTVIVKDTGKPSRIDSAVFSVTK